MVMGGFLKTTGILFGIVHDFLVAIGQVLSRDYSQFGATS